MQEKNPHIEKSLKTIGIRSYDVSDSKFHISLPISVKHENSISVIKRSLHKLFMRQAVNSNLMFCHKPISRTIRFLIIEFHDILHPAMQDLTELIDGIDLQIPVVPQPVKLGIANTVPGVKVILRDSFFLHRHP